jgi:hypothetical protein
MPSSRAVAAASARALTATQSRNLMNATSRVRYCQVAATDERARTLA